MKFMLITLAAITAAVFALPVGHASADIIRFGLDNDENLGGPIDMLDDPMDPNSTSTATVEGITFIASGSTTSGLTATTNAGGGGFGVNRAGTDSTTQVEAFLVDGQLESEILTISINFDAADFEKVELSSIDLGNLAGATDGAAVSVFGGPTFTVVDGADLSAFGFTLGGSDIFTADAPITVNSGDVLVFSNPSTGAAGFDVEAISLHLTAAAAVPEPSSIALLAFGSLAMVTRRRRR